MAVELRKGRRTWRRQIVLSMRLVDEHESKRRARVRELMGEGSPPKRVRRRDMIPFGLRELGIASRTFYLQGPIVTPFVQRIFDALQRRDYRAAFRAARVAPKGMTYERFVLLAKATYGDFVGYHVDGLYLNQNNRNVEVRVSWRRPGKTPERDNLVLFSGVRPRLAWRTFVYIDEEVLARQLLNLFNRRKYRKAYEISGLTRKEISVAQFTAHAKRVFPGFDDIVDIRATRAGENTYARGRDIHVRAKLRRGKEIVRVELFFGPTYGAPKLCLWTFVNWMDLLDEPRVPRACPYHG